MIREFIAGVKRWWQRRFRAYVAAPARSGGTSWQQHRQNEVGFTCQCGAALAFSQADYVIRSQEHDEDCEKQFAVISGRDSGPRCACPVTDARYVKICPQCRLGHWKQAEGENR